MEWQQILYVNMVLKEEVPPGFADIDYNETDIYFILVIKNHEKQWLKDVRDALEIDLRMENYEISS